MIHIYFIHKGDSIPCYVGKTNNLKKRLAIHKHWNSEYTNIELIDSISDTEWKFWEEWYIELFYSWGFTLENKTRKGRGPGEGRHCDWSSKISSSLLLKNTSGPVFQFDKNSNLIKKWDAACIAEDYFNPGDRRKRDNIRACIRGKQKSAYGFIWKSKE